LPVPTTGFLAGATGAVEQHQSANFQYHFDRGAAAAS